MKKRKRHSPEQIVKKLRDADSMLAAGNSVGEVLQALEVSEATLSRWRSQYGASVSLLALAPVLIMQVKRFRFANPTSQSRHFGPNDISDYIA